MSNWGFFEGCPGLMNRVVKAIPVQLNKASKFLILLLHRHIGFV